MIEFISTTCSALDGMPVNESNTHRILRAFIGCAAAGLTYEDAVYNHPPPRGEQHDTIRVYSGHDPHADPQRPDGQLRRGNPRSGAEKPKTQAVHQ